MQLDSLNYTYNFEVESAYIITLTGNDTSEQLSKRCQLSCIEAQQPYKIWEAFDGTSHTHITYPDHAVGKPHYKWLKQMNDKLRLTEVATILSHFSLWCHCVEIDQPIVILEHDAIMVSPYLRHPGFNQINYLGNYEQWVDQRYPDFPPHAAATDNNRFICRAHAYAVDPYISRQLISHVIRFGLSAPADMLIRVDLFNIVQTGFYAYDVPGETTITGRDEEWQQHSREIFSTFL